MASEGGRVHIGIICIVRGKVGQHWGGVYSPGSEKVNGRGVTRCVEESKKMLGASGLGCPGMGEVFDGEQTVGKRNGKDMRESGVNEQRWDGRVSCGRGG